MKYDLGVIGTGEFAVHLVNGFMFNNPDLTAILSPRNEHCAARLANQYGHKIAADNQEVVSSCKFVLLAMLPSQLINALKELVWNEDQVIISVVTGISIEELNNIVAPAQSVICMPTNSAMIGKSILPVYPHHVEAEKFLSALGKPVALPDEKAFESCAVLGATYGWLLALKAETTQWLCENNVPEQEARELMAELFISIGEISKHRKEVSITTLANELRLPGGITEHGLVLFEENGALEKWQTVMGAILDRLSVRY